ncbi:PssE/Cps14G family polysaccharide biosynthesis glycosyltransferase [Romboutsia sedimentorum]|uniref:PssE/Cps14G family polysaccharide biosynthesis glycosyltransferase n=1 Tax=Romboutsia sedimentorum TaxID=1368474 RepID=UPI0024DEC4C0|nr:PssE/Cps14G family polysaccharide biosynthesis glycosyltransferase [Romboutsia sedimentorum]MDK2586347.1 PssE/Cps14G family polysaccharide biosynthesis glycosyltransferase [Romboutsia sedimentorum]
MIFITLGSQKFQFNRLLIEIDRLAEEGKISEKLFAQIGYSDYKPKNYDYKEFLNRDEFSQIMKNCEKVITHGGTGAIVGAIKQDKKVIAIPRLKKYEEHVDDHQIEITEMFESMNLIMAIDEVGMLENAMKKIASIELQEYESNTKKIIDSIEQFIVD